MACRSLIYIVDASKDVIQIIQEGSVPKVEVTTTLTYTGDALAQVNTPVALAATLVDEENQPVSGADISFQVAAQSCSALTGTDGVANCDVTIGTAGVYEVTVEFASDVFLSRSWHRTTAHRLPYGSRPVKHFADKLISTPHPDKIPS